ncbi:MAG: hypothetical protein ACK4JD_10870 [Thermoflexales bacterium]
MTTVELPTPHPCQRAVLEQMDRFNVLACGRRWGKDTLIDMIILPALLREQKVAVLTPRDPDRDKMIERAKLTMAELLMDRIVRYDSRTIAFKYGEGEIRYYTAKNHGSIRGSPLDWAVLNEAGELSLMLRLGKVWEETVRAALLDRKGRALICGTPRGITDFYTLYQRGVEGALGWRSWNYSTYDNPHLDPKEIEAMIEQEHLSKLAIEQEIYARFIQAEGYLFSGLDKVCVLEPRKPLGISGACVFGVDVGGVEDYTAVSVMSVRTSPIRELHLSRWRTPQIRITEGRLLEMVKEWKPAAMLIESNALGRYFYEELRYRLAAHNVSVKEFYTNNATKGDAIQSLRHAMEAQQLQLTNDEVGMAELAAYGMQRTQTGKPRFGSRDRSIHDDTVMARALAYQLASSYSPSATASLAMRASSVALSGSPSRLARNVYRVEEGAWKPTISSAFSLPR